MTARIEQVGWVLEHRRDLETDFRAFYHLSPRSMYALPGPEFMALAYRTAVFSGVMAARVAKLAEDERKKAGPAGQPGQETRKVPVTASPHIEYSTA